MNDLRRRAVKADGEKDIASLVPLSTAYLAHRCGSGMLARPRTVGAYALGTGQFIEYAATTCQRSGSLTFFLFFHCQLLGL